MTAAPSPAPTSARPGAPASLLIVEPRQLFARTVVLVARDLGVAEVRDTGTYAAGEQLLARRSFDGVLLGLGDALEGIDLLRMLRAGRLRPSAEVPVAVMTDACDAATVELFRSLAVQRVMLRPFKVKTVIEVIQGLVSRRT